MDNILFEQNPNLTPLADSLFHAEQALIQCFERGGKLIIGGNGGSYSDALHIGTELQKSFLLKRGLSLDEKDEFLDLPHGALLARELEKGLPVYVLGCNGALTTAILNDKKDGRFVYAQELMAIAQTKDLFLAISTSGEAEDLVMAYSVAKVKGITTLLLTGPDGGSLCELCDISIKTPGESTPIIQENHIKIYHSLCKAIESHFFV